MLLNQRIAAALQAGGARPAMVAAGKVTSYRQLQSMVAGTAAKLSAQGIGRGDRVAFQLPNAAAAVVLLLATLMLAAVPVPILPAYRQRELRHVLNTVRPRVLALSRGNRRFSPWQTVIELLQASEFEITVRLVDGHGHENVDGWTSLDEFCGIGDRNGMDMGGLLATEIGLEDTVMLLLSSGTTGLPKPIARAAGGYSLMIAEACQVFALNQSSVYLAVLPIAHGFVLNCPGILGALSCGSMIVLAENTTAATAMRLLVDHAVTHSTLVPALLAQWLDEQGGGQQAPTSLRYLQVGGARLDPVLAAQAESQLGLRVQQCYGMSEGLLCFTRIDDPETTRFHAQGRPLLPQDELLIVDSLGRRLGCGATGELITRGPYTIHRYLDDEEATARGFTADGYYRTGDLAHLDAAGNVYIDGRVTDVINRGGEKFSPEEIELLARSHPKLVDLACVGMRDRRFGEVACVFAVCQPGQSQLDDVIASVAAKQGRYISQDPTPEQGMFFRSDQLNFAKLGVPVLYADGGTDLVQGGKPAGEAARADYIAHRYHQPSDVYDPHWDTRGAIQDLRSLYEVGSLLVDRPDFPLWKPGSDFKRPVSP